MTTPKVLDLVAQFSQAIVFADPGNPGTVEGFPEKFGDLAAIFTELGEEALAAVCHQSVVWAVGLAEGKMAWEQGLEILGKTIDALQAVLERECSFEDAGFPAELAGDSQECSPATDSARSGEVVQDEPQPVSSHNEEQPEAQSAPQTSSNEFLDDEILGEFLSRQAEVMGELEKLILGFEDKEEGGSEWLLRVFHTLKGESALLGMTQISKVCHAVEDMLQQESVPDCADRLLETKDWFMDVFKNMAQKGPAPAPMDEILDRLKSPAAHSEKEEPAVPEPVKTAPAQAAPPAPPAPPAAQDSPANYKVADYVGRNILAGEAGLLQDFIEEAVEHLDAAEGHLLSIEANPEDGEPLNAVFRGFHTIKGLAGFLELDHVKDLAHMAENLLDMARRGDVELIGKNMDLVFESVDMMKKLVEGMIKAMEGDGLLQGVNNLAGLMGRLVNATDPNATQKDQKDPEPEAPVEAAPVAPSPPKSGFIPLGKMKTGASASGEKPAETLATVPATEKGAEPAAEAPQARKGIKVKEAVRVDAERLDYLIETIGELVIAESMVTHSSEIRDRSMSVQLAKNVDHLDKICRELQEIGMSLRMVPVKPVFQKMARLVRDLAKKQNRQVEFVMCGEDTELDKNVVDKIGDPLVHMIRNSVDHGIEPDPADRVRLGKPEIGRVTLRAFHKGGNICIEIEDDGRGLDRSAILAKATERGLIKSGENLTDREIFAMIFEAGFSTAAKVTEVSGRGVGMDVVRRNIEELRGTVDITSEVGKGTTFSIKLPLTLAIIEGMVVMVGEEHYIIPTLSVVRLVQPREKDFTHVFDRGEMLAFEGAQLPMFRLSSLFDVGQATVQAENAVVVVVEDEGKKIGLLADKLIGQQSIVIKSLGESIQGTDGLAGGAIMSDGKVALILDIGGLIKVAGSEDMTFPLARSRAHTSASLDRLSEETGEKHQGSGTGESQRQIEQTKFEEEPVLSGAGV